MIAHSSRSTRSAFTLVEVLVVVAIIVILIAMLLPAVQKVREAGNRAKCMNNLHNIGIAFHTYHTNHRAFPSGGRGWWEARTMIMGAPAPANQQAWGWAYQLLPYVEQEHIWGNTNDNVVGGTAVEIYFCPSLRPPTIFPYGGGMRAQIDYAGNGGTYGNPWEPFDLSRNSLDGPLVPVGQGPMGYTDMLDGVSNTMLIGEKFLNKIQATKSAACNDDQGYVGAWDNDALCWSHGWGGGSMPPRPHTTQGTCGSIFGTIHQKMMSVFCDGAVRPISLTISPTLWDNICSRKDGQAANLDGL